MAEEKDKAENPEDGKKKGSMMPLILVAVGAALGGGGVVMMTPAATDDAHHEAPPKKLKVVHHPDLMSFVFNPVKKRGSMTARVGIKFDYLVYEDHVDAAFEKIKIGWDKANDRCLTVLTQFSAAELQTDQGKKILRRRLVDELTMVFFPEEQQPDSTKARVAVVQDVLFTEFFLQN